MSRRIAVFVTVLLLVVGGALSTISYLQVLDLTRGTASERLRLVGLQLADMLGRSPVASAASLDSASTDPALTAALRDLRRIDTGVLGQALRRKVPSTARTVLAILDSAGTHRYHGGPPGSPAWFGPARIIVPGGEGIGPLVLLSDSTLYFDVQKPLALPGGLRGSLVQRTRLLLSPGAAVSLASLVGEGISILVGSPSTGAWTDRSRVVPPPPQEAIAADTVATFRLAGVEHLGTARPIAGMPWVVLLHVPLAVIDAPALGYLRRDLLVAILAGMLGILGAVLLGRRLSRPIREITDVTEKLAAGQEGPRADAGSEGEIGRLARSFNAMLDRVENTTHRLRQSEESLRAFVSHASLGIWHVEFDPALDTTLPPEAQIDQWYLRAPVTQCNPALARMQSVEQVQDLERCTLDCLFPRADPRSQVVLRDFIDHGFQLSQVESGGAQTSDVPRVYVNDVIGLLEGGRLRRIWGTRREVTVERLLDARLGQAQRLEAIGRLAGGVAHDFNNLLTVILAHSEMLLEQLLKGSEQHDGVEEIRQTALRAAQLTRQLLLFSRGQVARPGVLDLNQVVISVEAMLRRVIGEDIDLIMKLGAGLRPVRADQGQIEQVIMNLVVNARDAMPDGGSLELRTGEVELDAEYVRLRPTIQPGRYVMLAVTDTGAGMSPEVQQHAFEPFFTTKPKGRGTGLGLATVYGVVRQDGGDVAIYSELGRGTTIKVFLPARKDDDRAVGPTAHPEPESVAGSERILLIEDEPALRDMVRRALAGSGYSVIPAADGTEALHLSEQPGKRIDLVLTDMILPGMSGRELAVEFRSRRPDLPIIIMSGYTGETYPALESLPEGVGYMEKPFSLSDLRRRVRETLDLARAAHR